MAQEIIGREPEIKGLYATCSSWHIDNGDFYNKVSQRVYTPPVHRGI